MQSRFVRLVALQLASLGLSSLTQAAPHNLILFVPDGLRSQVVAHDTAPTLLRLQLEGVNFANSHSVFPTFTTANASAFATGHPLGDTGDFSNTVYTGLPIKYLRGSVTPFLENNPVLREVNDDFSGNYLNGQQFFGQPENMRRIAHIISDQIYERITGEKGYFDSRVVFEFPFEDRWLAAWRLMGIDVDRLSLVAGHA